MLGLGSSLKSLVRPQPCPLHTDRKLGDTGMQPRALNFSPGDPWRPSPHSQPFSGGKETHHMASIKYPEQWNDLEKEKPHSGNLVKQNQKPTSLHPEHSDLCLSAPQRLGWAAHRDSNKWGKHFQGRDCWKRSRRDWMLSHVAGGSLQSHKENPLSGESGMLVNAHRKPSNPENEGRQERRTNQHVWCKRGRVLFFSETWGNTSLMEHNPTCEKVVSHYSHIPWNLLKPFENLWLKWYFICFPGKIRCNLFHWTPVMQKYIKLPFKRNFLFHPKTHCR